MRIDADLAACADLVRRGDPERFLAAMAAPPLARRLLFPLYAFNVEVSRAPWLTAEPVIAEMRLQWWRDALEEIRAGSTVRRHEVVTPLAAEIDASAAALLDQLVAARRWDIYRDPFDNEEHFRAHLDQTAGHLLRVAAKGLGQADEDVLRDAGFAHGLAGWLRAIPALEAAGRIPLLDGRPEALRDLARDGLAALARARASRAAVSPEARAALVPLYTTGPILRRAAADPARVGQGALDSSPLRNRLTLMARVATGRW